MNTFGHRDIEFILISDKPDLEYIPNLSVYPLVEPYSHYLYRVKLFSIKRVTKPYFCFLDGGEDSLPEDFLDRCDIMVNRMCENNLKISYGDEEIFGQLHQYGDFNSLDDNKKTSVPVIHHAPICETAFTLNLDWPKGNYWFEGLCYWRLAAAGYFYHTGIHYKWNPSTNGARNWPSTRRGLVNSIKYVFGKPEEALHFSYELEES